MTDHGVFGWLLLLPGSHSGCPSLPQGHAGQLDEGPHAGGDQGGVLVIITELVVALNLEMEEEGGREGEERGRGGESEGEKEWVNTEEEEGEEEEGKEEEEE